MSCPRRCRRPPGKGWAVPTPKPPRHGPGTSGRQPGRSATAFIPARHLKPHYRVEGHFYQLAVPGAEPLPCRSVLEITALEAGHPSPPADAIFVMMNPGSSKPIHATPQVVGCDHVAEMPAGLAATRPDTTQYQIMRVMHHAGWQRVRVINLSDLREPRSATFAQRYIALEKRDGGRAHSVFAPQRATELRRHLARTPQAPIVCAWGVGKRLDPLIAQATGALASDALTGLAKPDAPGKYFHPLPTLQRDKEQWVAGLLAQLQREGWLPPPPHRRTTA